MTEPDFSARYRLYDGSSPSPFEEGECAVALAADSLTLKPPGRAPMRIAFAEAVRTEAADHGIRIALRAGERIELMALGRRYDELVASLARLRRGHKLRALLLDEKPSHGDWETGAYLRRSAQGQDLGGDDCAVHLMRASLAVVPENEAPFVVPYGEIDGLSFNPDLHGTVISLGETGRIALVRFARRTDAIHRRIESDLAALATRRAQALQEILPDLGAFALRRLVGVLRDGVAAHRSAVDEAAPGAFDAIWRGAMPDPARRAFAEELRARATDVYLAIKEFKGIGSSPSDSGGDTEGAESGSGEISDGTPGALLGHQFLYFFAIERALVVEVPSMEDSATYVFRAGDDARAIAMDVSRALASIQFRREPVYMDEERLLEGPGRRYLEAVRTLGPLQAIRAAFVGRVTHASQDSWRAGLEELIARLGYTGPFKS